MRWLALSLVLACTSPGRVGDDLRSLIAAGIEEGLNADELTRRVGQRPVIDTRQPEDRTAIRIADYELSEGSELPLAASDVLVYWTERDDRLIGALYRRGRGTLWEARILPP